MIFPNKLLHYSSSDTVLISFIECNSGIIAVFTNFRTDRLALITTVHKVHPISTNAVVTEYRITDLMKEIRNTHPKITEMHDFVCEDDGKTCKCDYPWTIKEDCKDLHTLKIRQF